MKPVDPRLLRFASAARGFLILQVIIGLLQVAAVLAFSWLLAAVLAAAATEVFGPPLTDFPVPQLAGPEGWGILTQLSLIAALALLRGGLTWAAELTAARAAAKVKSQLRSRATEAMVIAGQNGRADVLTAAGGPAQAMTTLGPGLDALDGYFSRFLPQLVLTALSIPVFLTVLAFADITTAVTVAVTMPLIPVFMVLIGWSTQAAQRTQQNRLNSLARTYLDVVQGLSTLKVFNRQHRQRENLTRISDAHRRSTMKVLRISFLSGFVLELAASLSVALVAVSIGLRLIDGTLGLFIGLFVLLIVPEAYLPLRQVGAAYHSATDGQLAAEEVLDLLESAEDDHAEKPQDDDAVPSAALIKDSLPTSPGLYIRGLGVVRGDAPVLSELNLDAPAGEITVLTGPSGAGKSTLFAALLGLVRHTGSAQVRLDPLRPNPWWSNPGGDSTGVLSRELIAHSGQRHGLRSGTVGENIALGDSAPDHDLAVSLLEELDLGSALAPDPRQALNLRLGAGGSGLSGGQAHRVAVARAVYRARRGDLPVLLLDEPSAALDAPAEQRLLLLLRTEAAAGRSVVVISHRPGLIAAADHRVEISAGQITSDAAQGAHHGR